MPIISSGGIQGTLTAHSLLKLITALGHQAYKRLPLHLLQPTDHPDKAA
jgi:hypothetical protein